MSDNPNLPEVGREPYIVRRDGSVLDRSVGTLVGFVWRPRRGTWHGRLAWTNVPLVTTASHRAAAAEAVWTGYKTGRTAAFVADRSKYSE
jgi:hypothetical protein